jgi:hypothetical protein
MCFLTAAAITQPSVLGHHWSFCQLFALTLHVTVDHAPAHYQHIHPSLTSILTARLILQLPLVITLHMPAINLPTALPSP